MSKPPFSASRFFVCLAILVVVAWAGICAWYVNLSASPPAGIPLTDYREAQQTFRQMYRRTATRIDALSLLGEMAAHRQQWERALTCFREIPSTDPRYGLSARLQQGQVCLRLNQALDAEQNLREFLDLTRTRRASPEVLRDAYSLLVFILSVQLRFEERREILADMHALQLADVFDSKQFFFPNLLIWNSATGRHRLGEFLGKDPEDVRLNIAQGRYLTTEGKLSQAQAHLENWHQRQPADLSCLAALLECYFEQNNWARLKELAVQLPEYQENEPWLLTRMRGEIANHAQEWPTAVRQFERLRQLDPASPWAQTGLARAHAGLKQTEARAQALQRSLVLSQIRVDLMTVKEDDPQPALSLAKLCDQAGLTEAAETFRMHAARIKATANQRRDAGNGAR